MGMFKCDNCGRLYVEPETIPTLVTGSVYDYEVNVNVCPLCQSASGHDWAEWLDEDTITEMLEGVDYEELKKIGGNDE